MDEDRHAREALEQADVLARRMRAQGRWHVTVIALLGLLMFALIAAGGLLTDPPLQGGWFVLALMTLLGLVIYTASRKVIPRHHRLLYSVITPLGAALFTLTVVLGPVFFPGVIWWWVIGAAASTLPFWIVIAVNLSTRRER
ncbi:hypothetical protein [Nonomuraea helvata]|uniref:Uncharacterized protein n=1 Tax=Nonomuraea helvata TaxID=37484 RepID=A0ABV5SAH7_9ACTN